MLKKNIRNIIKDGDKLRRVRRLEGILFLAEIELIISKLNWGKLQSQPCNR